ncbi:hypothetical protein SBA3_70005 [Candidatus Sulfopaludibacter sp. SbA3]|nr:hypothetical protein SBA3_70005 [Candidatus Sulfopaludibacter sp. SbA3]
MANLRAWLEFAPLRIPTRFPSIFIPSPMNRLVALLYIGFGNVLLLALALTPDKAVDRVTELAKRFPPEVIVPVTPPATATFLRSYCVYPSLDTKPVTVKPCQANARTFA